MSKEKPVTIRLQDGVSVVALDRKDIWDGADLCLLRETLGHLILMKQCRNVGIDMQQVKYIASGFFGMLCDCHDLGVSIRLLAPQPQIKRMIWFRQFFGEVAEGVHSFLSEPRQILSIEFQPDDCAPSESKCEPNAKTTMTIVS